MNTLRDVRGVDDTADDEDLSGCDLRGSGEPSTELGRPIVRSVIEPFDNAALSALTASNPLPPLPSEYPAGEAFFTVTFFYNELVSCNGGS